MASLNRVLICGNLGADPDLRYTQNQTPVCTLSVATSEFTGKGDDRKEVVEWHRVIVWSKAAENCSKYLAKGRSVLIEGRLQTRKWTDKDGIERYSTEIIAHNVQFIGGNPESKGGQRNQSRSQQSNQYQGSMPDDSEIPF